MSDMPESLQNQGRTRMLVEKWKPVLEHGDLPAIKDPYKRAVLAVTLENQAVAQMQENAHGLSQNLLTEYVGPPTNNMSGGNISTFDPILISLVRRALPNLMAYDVAGVQPMTGP